MTVRDLRKETDMKSLLRRAPRFYSVKDLAGLAPLQVLTAAERRAMEVVARVLPFRTNDYVIEELIDWTDIPADPIFQLTFPQPGMLEPHHFAAMEAALARDGSAGEIRAVADAIRLQLNPQPEGQLQFNTRVLDGRPVPGLQHKYRQSCLVFPSAGQTCHAYCTFCFRWAQFVGMSDLKLATDESLRFCDYLRRHRELTDVLFTGGDPLVMRAEVLARYVEPLLGPGFEHVRVVRLGTKSLSYWPYRFLSDDDTDALLRLLERVVAAGKHLAIMAHFNHWKELATPAVRNAIERLRSLGAVVRTQSPIVAHINDDADVWVRMWEEQVRLGCVPYYMFVARDTGAQKYFRVPLSRGLAIYRRATARVSGLARTARGPIMSALPGKIVVDGVTRVDGEKAFVLSFLQAREPAWCKRPFFARFDRTAAWWTELQPASGAAEFSFMPRLRRLLARVS